jgi:hypothetical protein
VNMGSGGSREAFLIVRNAKKRNRNMPPNLQREIDEQIERDVDYWTEENNEEALNHVD